MIKVANEPDLRSAFQLEKKCKRRKSGNTWNIYTTNGSSGKRFQSNVAINDYLTKVDKIPFSNNEKEAKIDEKAKIATISPVSSVI